MLYINTLRLLQGCSSNMVASAAFLAIFLFTSALVLPQDVQGQEHSSQNVLSAAMTGQQVLGDVIPFGAGTARSWVDLDGEGRPIQLGVTLTEAALTALPPDVTPGMVWAVEYMLEVPKNIKSLPFKHIGINWNPKGHAPAEFYSASHFDFHFYTVDAAVRNQITARGDDIEKCNKPPLAGSLPASYVLAPDSHEPGMGSHWVDPASAEFHGNDFTNTFIYGTYDGNIIFFEPMITIAYLKSKPDLSVQLEQPSKFTQSGYYPTNYSVRYDQQRMEYTIALGGMEYRERARAS